MYPGHWAAVAPDRAAVIDTQTGETRSYKALNDRSNRLARLFRDRGIERGGHVAVFLENRIDYYDVIWAALRSGVYLTTVNRYLTAAEAGYIVNDCGAEILISSAVLGEVAREIPSAAPRCKTHLAFGGVDGFDDFEDAIAQYPADPLDEEPAGSFMLYSSGTTGRPKGVMKPLPEGLVASVSSPVAGLSQALWNFNEETIYLSPAPLYHSAPLAFSTGAQTLGGTVALMPKFDPQAALRAIETCRVTHSQWVPTMFSRMLKLGEADRARHDLSSHRVAIHAAAPCPKAVKEAMLEWWGDILYEYYAGTELNGFTHATPQEWRAKPGTVGKSILGAPHICDETGRELPPGEEGLVYFELPEMPFRYHGDDDKTRDAQHPDHPTWSKLGDVGYVDEDGYLFLTDRATFMIISGGVNIYPQEIEDALIMHPKVADVAVVGAPNADMGEEVKAVVQPAPGVEPSDVLEAELLEYIRERIAHYKAPRSIDFEAELPRLPTGKLYKRLLKDRYWGRHDTKIV